MQQTKWLILSTLILIISVISVITSIYFEQALNLLPCPMCIGQRAAMMATVALTLLALISYALALALQCPMLNITKNVLSLLTFIILALGLYIAVRQVYLQSLPPGAAPACGPGLNFIIHNFPASETIKVIFQGSGECAKVQWRALGLSIANWSAIVFGVSLLLNFCSILYASWSKNTTKQ